MQTLFCEKYPELHEDQHVVPCKTGVDETQQQPPANV